MTNVVSMDGVDVSPKKACEDVVKTLEALLSRAQAGEILGVGVALCLSHGGIGTAWVGGHLSIEMTAAIARLQFDFMAGWNGAA